LYNQKAKLINQRSLDDFEQSHFENSVHENSIRPQLMMMGMT